MFGNNHFGAVDYIVLSLTLLLSLGIGVYFATFGKQSKDEILMGGRNMSPIPVAISMLVTYFSAATILGYPAEVFSYGTQLLFMAVIVVIFVPVAILVFVNVLYDMKLTSIYEYLELRFKSRWVRWLTSITFILQLLLTNGVNLFAPAIALEAILGIPVWLSIAGIGVIGTIYTAIGGLKAVIWTDVFQFIMISVGMGAIVIKGFLKAGGVGPAFETVAERDRLKFFDWSVDPYERQNTINFLLGGGFQIITQFGTHQPHFQRYCSLPSKKAVYRTYAWTVPINAIMFCATIIVGVSVVATYAGCDPILLGKISRPDAIIPYFVVQELDIVPGMMGIFVSCIFSAVLSSISSGLNSLAAVTWEDFVAKIPVFQKMSPEGHAISTKVITAIYGAISIGIAFGAQGLGTIFQVAMNSLYVTAGPMGAIFLCGLFLPFVNRQGAIAGILAGMGVMMVILTKNYDLGTKFVLEPRLPTDLEDCPADTDFSTVKNVTIPARPEFDYPDKIFTMSYLLYAFVGAVITTTVACAVSVVTRIIQKYSNLREEEKVEEAYIHPWIKELNCIESFVKSNGDSVTSLDAIVKSESGSGRKRKLGIDLNSSFPELDS